MTNNFINILEPNCLILSWMVPLISDSQQSRRRYSVGKIWRRLNSREVVFSYTDEELEAAIDEGFEGYPTFPLETDHVYPDAMEVFGRRLPSKAREDFGRILQSYALDPEARYTRFQLLSATGGRLATDSYEFIDPLLDIKVGSRRLFDVAGVRRYFDSSVTPKTGDDIFFQRDFDNEHDENAVKVINIEGEQIGWVNKIQSSAVSNFLSQGSIKASVFRINGRRNYPRIFSIAEFNS